MIISESTVRKLVIRSELLEDRINVFLEDCGEGKGRATITCCDDSWNHYWGSMGSRSNWGSMSSRSIEQFLATVSIGYLVGKFNSGNSRVDESVVDVDACIQYLKKEVLIKRRDRELSQDDARDLMGEISDIEYSDNEYAAVLECYEKLYPDAPQSEFGIKTKASPDYEYLTKIVTIVQDALKDRHAKN